MKTLKKLKGTAKLQFIWDYYKLPMALIALALYFVGYLFYRDITTALPEIYLAYVNLEIGEDLNQELTQSYIEQLEGKQKNSIVKVYHDLVLTEKLQNIDVSYLQACQMKILASIDNQQLDLVLMNKEAFDAFSQCGYLMDLNVFQQEHALDFLDSFLVENLEILTDNATEVLLDSTITYESETATYPMGIDVSKCSRIKKADFSDRVYLGVLANSPRSNQVADYISYLFDKQ